MARRASAGDDNVSLFPFLSILVCVIGILTLMIVASSLGDIGKKPDPILVERTNRYQELQKQIAQSKTDVAELEKRLQGSELGEARISAVQKEYDRVQELMKQQEGAKEALKRTAELAQLRDSLKARLQQLEEEQKTRTSLAAELDKEIEAKGRPPRRR